MGESQSGGGVDTDVGGAGRDEPSTNYGQSPGAMGGRQPNTVPDVQPSIYGRSFDPGVYSEPETSIVPSFDGAMGSGASTNAALRDNFAFTRGIAALTGEPSPGQTSDGSYMASPSPRGNPMSFATPPQQDSIDRAMFFEPSGGTGVTPEQVRSERMMAEPASSYVSPRVVSEFLGGNYDVTDPYAPMGSGMETRSNLFPVQLGGGQLPTGGFQNIIDRPPSGFQNVIDRPPSDFQNVVEGPSQGFQNVIDRPQQGFQNVIDGPSPSFQNIIDRPPSGFQNIIGAAAPVGNPMSFAGTAKNPMSVPTDEATTLANLVTTGKTGNQKQEAQKLGFIDYVKKLGKDMSGLSFSDIVGAVGDFLRGDPNYKGPSAAQQQLMGVPGPGPFVGGGVPSPSGPAAQSTGGMAKDPCPPGFRFDATLQQCVPIVAPAAPAPVAGTAPVAPTPATGGISNIPNAYPFTLTPPIGAPIGNIAPVRS
tara:strand:+ start:517 stop:1947 length:1431 start_codon:yes stop_codon:yes gene_type:complete